MTDKQVELSKQYCGAVAVSWYRSNYTVDAIKRFIKAGCKTNIHYVVSKDTIAEAVERLSGKGFVEGVNAVIFLMHKPVGQGELDKIVTPDNPYLKDFCRLINEQNQPFKIGFDSCGVPMLITQCPNINRMALDTCEGGRYSCYISSDMVISPCSFDRVEKYGVSLRGSSIREAWNSKPFEDFRDSLRRSCPTCKDRAFCMGGCPLVPEIVICNSKQKSLLNQA
jgi:radical SAM protein with 4Fe4S-binding SPASM domain